MKTYTITELKTETATVLDAMRNENFTLITQNGKPTSLMMDIGDMDLEQVLLEARRYRSRLAINDMRSRSKKLGNDTMSEDEIEAIIAATRKERA